jgi:hypothetical protein
MDPYGDKPDDVLGDVYGKSKKGDPYAHWNEEAPIVKARENDYDSPFADMSDEAIKQAVYDREDDDWDEGDR